MNPVSRVERYTLYALAALGSLLISFWLDMRTAVINPDGICYLYSAEYVGIGGLKAAMHLCPQALWPFYSFLIYLITQVTHFSPLTAAFTVDALFSAISVVAFVAVVKELGADFRTMAIAAGVILLSHQFNVLREDIIRDHGFWAAYLASIYFLLRFFITRFWLNALAFSGSLILATCFRVEGAIFLVFLPFFAFFNREEKFSVRVKQFFQLNIFLILGALAGALYLLSYPENYTQLGRVPEILTRLHHSVDTIVTKYHATQQAVSHVVLTHASLRDAGVVVLLLMIAWYLVNVVGNLSLAYTALVLYAWFTRIVKFNYPQLLVLIAYLTVNIFVTFAFFASNHFLAKRYLIALSLVCMLWVPFVLSYLWVSKKPLHRVMLWVAGIMIVVSGASSLFHFGHSKDYVRHAGDWLALNVPQNAKLYVNDYQVLYYSQHAGNKIFTQFEEFKDVTIISHGEWQTYDYLALMKGDESEDETAHVMQEIHMRPIQVFVSENGSHIYIYKVIHRGKKK